MSQAGHLGGNSGHLGGNSGPLPPVYVGGSRTPARRQLGNFCREGWGREELGGHDQHHPLAAKRCFKRSGMIRALKMMIHDEALALKLTPYLKQRLFHVLQAEHLDVGFMLSGFRRRHKVSQRPLRVLERLPRRERRVSKGRTSARTMKCHLNSP